MAAAPGTVEPFHVMPTAADARPRLVFRVGISGHRNLPDADLAKLDKTLGEIFDAIEAKVRTVHAEPSARTLYSDEPPILLFVSPLADGADRIAARVALAKHWRLAVPMPFARASYELDFSDSLSEFRTMLTTAKQDGAIVELDGDYDAKTRPAGYLAVGKFVVRHCDLLIAIWDGAPANGLGGTGDIVPHAIRAEAPVLHIESKKPHEVWLIDQVAREKPIQPEELATLIKEKIGSIIEPIRNEEAAAARQCYFRGEAIVDGTGKRDYYNKGIFEAAPPAPYPKARRIFSWLMKVAKKPKPPDEREPTDAPAMPINCTFLFDHFQRADCLATAYSEIHRGAFVLIYLSGALALVAAFGVAASYELQTVADQQHYVLFALIEIVLLIGIWILYLDDRWTKRRERWLDYRLLAEMLREADMLALMGRRLSNRAVNDHAVDLAPRAQWVPQAYHAIMRAAGVTGAVYNTEHLRVARQFAADGRFTDQIRYHIKNGEKTQSLNYRLKIASNVLFFGTLIIAVLKLFSLNFDALHWMHLFWVTVFASIFPAFAYALFGIRNQAEFEIVGRRSERMKARLKHHRDRMRNMGAPGLTSLALGEEAVRASEAMRHDVADWIGIFEMKEAEK